MFPGVLVAAYLVGFLRSLSDVQHLSSRNKAVGAIRLRSDSETLATVSYFLQVKQVGDADFHWGSSFQA